MFFWFRKGPPAGRRAGLTAAMGLARGNLVHTLGAALGISVIFQTSALAFQALKLSGVAYLAYLALKTVRSDRAAENGTTESHPQAEALFRRGLMMNVLNPKVALFFLAFLPQFVSPEAGPVWVQMDLYGVLFTCLVAVVFGAIGLFSGKLNQWLVRSGRFRRFSKWAIAGVYASLTARLVFVER